MPTINDVLQRIREQKKEKKKISEAYRDVLAQSKPYQDALEKLKEARTKKAKIEAEIRQEFASEFEKVEKITQSLKADTQLLTDLALNKFMKGESIEVTDENDVKYEPVFKVAFKKQS